ncbi:D-tyrosyl-tRNA(Tyr) deacylase [Thermosipho melanesiensis]|uniref:D-aminoacyl-tRNA deacylase n=2 Tax=Thermosipho melanesiensis TaxID=46541 RepID=DTD_THEM4|nr:D-aminoacyl-tRNA deacylase [Thermosipho melanesiensis]A6LML3.1 RecName: Full=D-aminoacyl-tRNA deacylase; Short=DTD; AltName: Full=Gly-tRNA(Ala) deacylase [Thermosipho melanesiensis BI429]ABR31164.1 D-tyrosyl-tRNA(Tyr) deacylase [Thermosipho melanesiensis BI429]APT74254.1 tyrosyl-tRNA deacylase [Thermosipho melanesiensis]OOC36193.1 D-tyrosyl-tRNA(Tyr) deacylase [Thermosipho melanesiensis]OOC37011.1 D-tyrosyl-tRNA(Tyr) deacylase [Thermosipho melanesiensis]OOC37763.1 D-tyrosyl-tRNA(Tyr) deacy
MRAVVQRVNSANVDVNGKIIGKIKKGLLVLLGVGKNDTESDAEYLVNKILNLRIFDDNKGKMNLSLLDIKGDILIVSQFTLYGDCRRGRRPSYSDSASPEKAKKLYEYFVEKIRKEYNIKVETGEFGAYMKVNLENDGPVTLLLDSKKVF